MAFFLAFITSLVGSYSFFWPEWDKFGDDDDDDDDDSFEDGDMISM